MKKIALPIAAAVLAMTAAASAGAAELPAYEKAGLPVSAVQVQVLGAGNVEEAVPVAASLTLVQRMVLAPRKNVTTAQGPTDTADSAIQ